MLRFIIMWNELGERGRRSASQGGDPVVKRPNTAVREVPDCGEVRLKVRHRDKRLDGEMVREPFRPFTILRAVRRGYLCAGIE